MSEIVCRALHLLASLPVPVRDPACAPIARQERNDKYAKEFQDELMGKLGKMWPFGQKD